MMSPDTQSSSEYAAANARATSSRLEQTRQTITQIAENFTARRVYAEPYQQQGVAVIPAAEIRGGGGVGGQGEHGGGGMGMRARPVGAFVLKDGTVAWKPAFDLSRVVFRGQIVVIALLFTVAWVLGRRRTL
jgi:hypothetical protein